MNEISQRDSYVNVRMATGIYFLGLSAFIQTRGLFLLINKNILMVTENCVVG